MEDKISQAHKSQATTPNVLEISRHMPVDKIKSEAVKHCNEPHEFIQISRHMPMPVDRIKSEAARPCNEPHEFIQISRHMPVDKIKSKADRPCNEPHEFIQFLSNSSESLVTESETNPTFEIRNCPGHKKSVCKTSKDALIELYRAAILKEADTLLKQCQDTRCTHKKAK